jgi:hypothetical protein
VRIEFADEKEAQRVTAYREPSVNGLVGSGVD